MKIIRQLFLMSLMISGLAVAASAQRDPQKPPKNPPVINPNVNKPPKPAPTPKPRPGMAMLYIRTSNEERV